MNAHKKVYKKRKEEEMKIAYCIFGQLRSFKKCWPTMKQHLEKGDVYVQAQRCFDDDEDMIASIGDDWLVYSSLRTKEEYLEGYDVDDLQRIGDNWCGPFFDRGSCNMCVYSQYHAIGKALEGTAYDKIVMLRSDMFFLRPFPELTTLEEGTLYHADVSSWDGFNPFTLTLKGSMSHVLKIPFEVLSQRDHPFRSRMLCHGVMNLEKFLMCVWSDFRTHSFPIVCFLTADGFDSVTTWSKPMFDAATGHFYKYTDDYRNCLKGVC